MEDNHIYQYGLLNALMEGISESGVTVAKFLQKGNQGIGTFVRMDGELLALDGKVYQLRAEGSIREAEPEDQIPFGVCTNFVSQATKQVTLSDKTMIDEVLQEFSPHSENLFITYRILGHFKKLKARTVRGQEYKHQPLSELGDSQYVKEYEDIEGTIIGFRSPKSWQGFSVAGEHMHFISHDKTVGGHVLELISDGEIVIKMAVVSNVHVELPTSREFNDAKLVMNDEGIKKVEG